MNIIDTAIICDGRCEFEFIGQLSHQQLQIYGARRENKRKDMGLMKDNDISVSPLSTSIPQFFNQIDRKTISSMNLFIEIYYLT